MGMLENCLLTTHAASQSEIIAACYQAGAAERAAILGQQATVLTGVLALVSAGIAFAAIVIQVNASKSEALAAEEREHHRKARYTAAIFLAEIKALMQFLVESGAINETKDTRYKVVHPGDHWLKTYQDNPGSLEVFSNELAQETISFVCRALNTLQNMRWLADNLATYRETFHPENETSELVRIRFQGEYDSKVKETQTSLQSLCDMAKPLTTQLSAAQLSQTAPPWWSRQR